MWLSPATTVRATYQIQFRIQALFMLLSAPAHGYCDGMDGNPALISAIQQEIVAAGGSITFARFMELALYHPQFGYYMTAARSKSAPCQSEVGRAVPARHPRIGKDGDYFTSVSVGPLLGRILARQFQQWGVAEVLEFGGHRGQLRNDILAAAPTLNYRSVEVGDPLPDQITGCVFSNEFLDALPVHRVCGDQEIYVAERAARPFMAAESPANGRDARSTIFQEVLGPLSDPRLPRLPDGYRSEINLRALDWLTDIARRLTHGFVLTIDYGFERAEYFSPHHAAGHLQCYYRHTKSGHPYLHIGDQDLTAHVDFTALIEHGQSLGLEPVLLTDQARYLLQVGEAEIADIVTRTAGQHSPERNAVHQLLHSTMGQTFKVLIQRKHQATTPEYFRAFSGDLP